LKRFICAAIFNPKEGRSMAKVTLSPVTRISGLLSIDVFLGPDGVITEANCNGEQFRGFEMMLKNRKITDAVYFTERICGICSMAHGFTAANLVRKIYGLELSAEAVILGQAMLGAEFLQNHIRHFYLLALPDYLDSQFLTAAASRQNGSRFAPLQQQRLAEHYYTAMDYSAKCHEMLVLFGGKIPHQHGLTAIGTAVSPTAENRLQFISLLQQVEQFIQNIMLPDAYLLAEVYPDYFEIGAGAGRFISFGLFDLRYGGHFPAGISDQHNFYPVLSDEIYESIAYAWYKPSASEQIAPAPEKPAAYSWTKAPRYHGLPLEGGPLARKIIASNLKMPLATGTMARLVARAEETALIAAWMGEWLKNIPKHGEYIKKLQTPLLQQAVQTNDAPRGPLLHSMTVKEDNIASYNIITPSTWNFSPKDEQGRRGPAEESLVGTIVSDPRDPVEIGRIIRSFDPCLSCGTHLIDLEGKRLMNVTITI
jgi:hydrogenase large subunit